MSRFSLPAGVVSGFGEIPTSGVSRQMLAGPELMNQMAMATLARRAEATQLAAKMRLERERMAAERADAIGKLLINMGMAASERKSRSEESEKDRKTELEVARMRTQPKESGDFQMAIQEALAGNPQRFNQIRDTIASTSARSPSDVAAFMFGMPAADKAQQPGLQAVAGSLTKLAELQSSYIDETSASKKKSIRTKAERLLASIREMPGLTADDQTQLAAYDRAFEIGKTSSATDGINWDITTPTTQAIMNIARWFMPAQNTEQIQAGPTRFDPTSQPSLFNSFDELPVRPNYPEPPDWMFRSPMMPGRPY